MNYVALCHIFISFSLDSVLMTMHMVQCVSVRFYLVLSCEVDIRTVKQELKKIIYVYAAVQKLGSFRNVFIFEQKLPKGLKMT